MISSKAQVFSLDMVIAMILIVLSIGILVHSFELRSYDLKEQSSFHHLKSVATSASTLLFETSACSLTYNSVSFTMPNCINTQASFNKSDLGLLDYKCNITSSTSITTDCTDSLPDPNDFSILNIVSFERTVVFNNGNLDYLNFYQCRDENPACTLDEGTITLRVWQ